MFIRVFRSGSSAQIDVRGWVGRPTRGFVVGGVVTSCSTGLILRHLIPGKTDRIELRSFYPFLGLIVEQFHNSVTLEGHPALSHTFVGSLKRPRQTIEWPDRVAVYQNRTRYLEEAKRDLGVFKKAYHSAERAVREREAQSEPELQALRDRIRLIEVGNLGVVKVRYPTRPTISAVQIRSAARHLGRIR